MEQAQDFQLISTERRTILCPRCEEEQPMRDFATLGMSPLYAQLLTPIFRCKLCNHLFAPRAWTSADLSASLSHSHGNGSG
jgi:hypothetical protein